MKKHKIKELEAELRILYNELYILNSRGYHARYNNKLARYKKIVEELETISIKYKFKKLLRRIFRHGKD